MLQVFVMANHWGDGYYHFLLESLPRILTMQDVLLEQPDIKVMEAPPAVPSRPATAAG